MKENLKILMRGELPYGLREKRIKAIYMLRPLEQLFIPVGHNKVIRIQRIYMDYRISMMHQSMIDGQLSFVYSYGIHKGAKLMKMMLEKDN